VTEGVQDPPAATPATVTRTDVLKASPPMFRTPSVDRVTRVHPIVPVVVFVPAIAVVAYLAGDRIGVLRLAALALAGWAFWGLVEYWTHRVVFHIEPEQGFGARLHWMVHGVHHDHPNDPLRLVMPPAVSVPGSAAFVLVFVLLFGVGSGLAVGAGFLVGYLVYDMTHHALHHHTPRTAFGRRLREKHMRHHFQDDTRGYGISAPWWDRVFGTAPERPGDGQR
jgi:sterol desaturase/sphingolipid hydroxylase (fatty acid hydroxylase superfamily)